jgi:AcrR family transcriptional regulator
MTSPARTRLLDAATDLFARHGFNAVGVDRIITEVNTTKTTFYNHFESKDQLIVEVLKVRDAQELSELAADIQKRAGEGNPSGQLLAIFDAMDSWFRESGFRGCMFMRAAAEFPDENDPIHQTAIARGKHLAEFIFKLAQQAGASEASSLAEQFSILLAGAIVQRQLAQSVDSARTARAAAASLLRTHLPV